MHMSLMRESEKADSDLQDIKINDEILAFVDNTTQLRDAQHKHKVSN
jgi:transcriptional regulator of NAD metabolism